MKKEKTRKAAKVISYRRTCDSTANNTGLSHYVFSNHPDQPSGSAKRV